MSGRVLVLAATGVVLAGVLGMLTHWIARDTLALPAVRVEADAPLAPPTRRRSPQPPPATERALPPPPATTAPPPPPPVGATGAGTTGPEGTETEDDDDSGSGRGRGRNRGRGGGDD